jgi:hypothetical protein
LQKDGVFIVNDDVPDGQDVLHALLLECSETIKELASHATPTSRVSTVGTGAVQAAA